MAQITFEKNAVVLSEFMFKDTLVFQFLPSMKFVIHNRISHSPRILSVVYTIKNSQIEDRHLVSFLQRLYPGETKITFVQAMNGQYFPLDPKTCTKEEVLLLLKKKSYRDVYGSETLL